jgi:hypothetical protein
MDDKKYILFIWRIIRIVSSILNEQPYNYNLMPHCKELVTLRQAVYPKGLEV